MAKQLYIDLNVRANTQQAKAEFQSLQKSLSDVALQTTKIKDISVKSESLNKASAAAKELQRHLSNAVNVDTGKLNLNKLNASLKASKTNIGDLSSSLLKAGGSGQEAFMKLAQSVANADRPLITMGSHLNNFLNTLKNTARWQISSTILHGFMGSLQSAYGYAKDLNQSLNNIRIVTGKGVDEMSQFAVEANNAAKALSTSTTAYTDAALIYYQQGLGDKKVKERTDATIKLANVSRQSAEEVSSQMTAIWNNFEQEGKTAEYYADVITALGATTASSSSEIAEGLQKFAAVSDTVGLSYEKASAALATIVAETRQSADVVGTAFKTMFARLEGLNLGETLEDGVTLNKYSAALETVGVNILDSNKQLKDMDTILDELGNKWNNIDKSQQVALAQTVAGVRQYTQFISLMDNYDTVLKNQQTAELSEGTLQKQADIYAESWEASQKRVKASLQSIYQALIDDKFFIAMNNGFSEMLDGLNNFIKGIGGLKGVLFGLSSLFLNYISDKITPAIQNLKISLITMFQSPEKQAKTYGEIMTNIMNAAKQNLGLNGTDKMTDSMKVQLNYIDKLSIAKNKLMAMDKKLSDSEKQQAEQELNLISLYQEEVQTLADKLTKEKENVNTVMDSMRATEIQKDVKASRQFDADANSGQTQEWKAIRDSFFDENGEVTDMNGFLDASKQYENAAQAERDYNTQTEMLIDTSENLTNEMRRGYEELVQYITGFKEGKDVTVDLGQYLGETGKQFEIIGNQTTSSAEKITLLDSCLEDLRALKLDNFEEVSKDMKEAEQASKALQKAILDNKNITKATDTFNEKVNNLKSTLVGGKRVTKEGVEEVNKLTISFEKGTNGAKKFVAAYKKMDDPGNADKINKTYENVQASQNKVEKAQEKLNSVFNNFNPSHIITIPEIFSKSASAGMQAAMVINSVKTLLQAWTDEDMDPMEKFTTSLMSVGMIIPGVMSGIQAVTGVINGLKTAKAAYNVVSTASNAIEESGIVINGARTASIYKAEAAEMAKMLATEGVIAAEEQEAVAESISNAAKEAGCKLTTKQILQAAASATAKTGETAATEGATTAQWNLNAAMSANPIGAFIAAIVALIAVFALLVIAFSNVKDSSPEAALKSSAETANQLRESADKLEQKAKTLREEFEKYDSVVDKLQSCTKGTQEWREALKEVNKTAIQLAKEYPELLTNPEYFTKDENGTILITEKGQEYAENQADKKAASASYAAIEAEYAKNLDQANVTYKDVYKASGENSDLMRKLGSNTTILNAENSDQIREGVIESLKQYYDERNTDYTTESLNAFADELLECGDNLVKFAKASQDATRQFETSTDLLVSSSQAFENTDATTKNIANNMMQEDIGNVSLENSEKIKSSSGDEQANIAKEMLEKYKISAGLEGDIVFDKIEQDKNGNLIIKYHKQGEEKESSSVSFETVNASVSTYDVAMNVDDYAEKAKEAQSNYSDELKTFSAQATNSKNTSQDGKASWEDVLSNYTTEQLEQMEDIDKNAQTLFGSTPEEFWTAAKNVGLSDNKENFEAQRQAALKFTSQEQAALNLLNPNAQFDTEGKYQGETATKDWTLRAKTTYASGVAKAKAQADQNGIDSQLIDDLVKSNTDNAKLPQIMDELGKIKFSDSNSIEQIKNLESKYNIKNADKLIASIEKIDKSFDITATNIATSANTAIENSKKIKQDSSIQEKELKEYESLGVEVDKYFTKMQDGTYRLVGSAEDFQQAVKSASQNSLFDVVDNYAKAKDQTLQKNSYANVDVGVFSNTTYDNKNDFDKNGQLTSQGKRNTAARLDYASSLGNLDLSNVANGPALLDAYTKAAEKGEAALNQFWNSLTPEQANTANAIIDAVDKQFSNITSTILKTATSVEELNSLTDKLLDSYGSYDYNAYAESLKGLASQYDNTTNELNEYNEALMSGNQAQIDATEGALKIATMAGEAAKKYNLTAEDIETHAKLIAKAYENSNNGAGMSAETAARLAIANERMNRGVKTLNENWEDWSKTLKTANKTSKDYAETLNDANEALADLTGAVDGAAIPLGFLDNTTADGAKHLEWMAQAAKGSASAINNLGAALAKAQIEELKFKEYAEDITTVKIDGAIIDLTSLESQFNTAKTYLDDFMTGYENSVISGASAVQSYLNSAGTGWIEALNTMAQATDMTTEEMKALLNEMGVDADLTVVEKTVQTKVPQYTNKTEVTKWDEVHNYPLETKTSTSITGYVPAEETIQVPQINMGKNNKGKPPTISYVGTSGSSSLAGGVSKSSTAKSTDSSSKKNTSAASHQHEINRYSNEENAINGLSKQYDRLSKAKDKAFGKGRIQALEQELQALKELKKASSNYLDAIVGSGNGSKVAQGIQQGKSVGSMIANGQLGGTVASDYRSLFNGADASGKQVEYTAKDSDGNEWLASSGFSLGTFNSMFGTNLSFNLDSFGNIQNRDSILNLLQNLRNSESDAYSRIADPSAGSATEYNKRIAYLDAIKERIEQYGETVETLGDKVEEYLDYISEIQEKNAEIISTKMETGVDLGQKTVQRLERAIKVLGDNIYKTAEGMSKWYDMTFKQGVEANKQQGDAYLQAMKETSDKVNLYSQPGGEFNENAIDPAHAAELFSQIEDGLDGLIDDVLEKIQQGKEFFGNTLDYWNEKLNKVNTAIENNNKILSHFQNVLNLLGKSADYEALGKILQGISDNAKEDYAQKSRQFEDARQIYNSAQLYQTQLERMGITGEALEQQKEIVAQALEDYQNKYDAMMTSAEAYIESINNITQNNINRIFAEAENNLSGEWGSLDALDSAMQRHQSVADQYLTKTNQIYETNKLLRQIQQDIDKTDSKIAKDKLKNFSLEIDALKQREKLSKSSLEIAKAQYEMLQAQIALEEAQNAKTTVRLQRDNEGNYGYVYTADQEQVNDAEQNYADKENEYYNTLYRIQEEAGQRNIELRKEFLAELQSLQEAFYVNGTISEEEYNKQLADLKDTYRALEQVNQEDFLEASTLLNDVAAQGQTETWISSFDDIITKHRLFNDESATELDNYNTNTQSTADELTDKITSCLQEANAERERVEQETKMGNKDLQRSINEVTSSTKQLSDSVTKRGGLADSMNTAMNKALNLSSAFAQQYDNLQKLVDKYRDAANEASSYYVKMVDLIHVQTAYNHAKNGAYSVAWGPNGVTANYNSGNNGGSGGGSSFANDITGSETNDEPKRVVGFSPLDNNYHLVKWSDGSTSKQSHVRDRNGGNKCIHCGYTISYGYKKIRSSGAGTVELLNLSTGQSFWVADTQVNRQRYGFKTGGYTGSWNGPDVEENGKLAFLHQKELVLNAEDTENILDAVKLIRQISQSIDLQAISQASGWQLAAAQYSGSNEPLQQDITIHAEFPNAVDHNEIEQAFDNLANKAAQFANRS